MKEINDNDEITDRILFGVQKAVRKLVEESAARNEELVTGDENGNVVIVPAKDLLKKFTVNKTAVKELNKER